jgi:riboflavin kinase/FMN adenylyltransferase
MVDDLPVSSTRIRGALNAGDVQTACALLGRPHFIRGEVVGGMGRGKTLGYPTINLQISGALVPGDGVYSGGYLLDADTKGNTPGQEKPGRTEGIYRGPAAISIGSSPTFENGSHGVEAHLIGWESDLYGETVTITFHQRLRDQYIFSDPAGLADQILIDVAKSRELFSVHDLEKIPQLT